MSGSLCFPNMDRNVDLLLIVNVSMLNGRNTTFWLKLIYSVHFELYERDEDGWRTVSE